MALLTISGFARTKANLFTYLMYAVCDLYASWCRLILEIAVLLDFSVGS